jgi:lysophospholipase L1-like esterase
MAKIFYFLLKILFSITVFFTCLEVSIYLFQLSLQNKNISTAKSSEYTILTLGESTTADAGTPNGQSWPRVLERLFHEKGISVTVINKALVGTTTTSLVAHLDSYIKEVQPDLVVTMMGVNDSPKFWYNNYDLVRRKDSGFELKSIKLIKFLINYEKIKEENSNIAKNLISPSALDYKDFNQLTQIIKQSPLGSEEFKKIENTVTMYLQNKSETEKSQFYALIGYEAQPPWGSDDKLFDKAYYFYNQAITHNIMVEHGLEIVLLLAKRLQRNNDCKVFIDMAINQNAEISDTSLNRLIECLPKESAYINSVLLKSNKDFKYIDSNIKPTHKNYQYFKDYLSRTKICWIAMSYPLRQISDELISLHLEKNPHILILENQNQFRDALKTHAYQDIFYDNFASDFGHTTAYGSELIAKNVFSKIATFSPDGVCHFPQ